MGRWARGQVGEWAVRTTAHQRPKGTDKAGQHVLAVELAVPWHARPAAVGAIDAGETPLRVYDPHELRAGGEPVGDLRQPFPRPIAGRENLHHQLGSERCEAGRGRLRQSFPTDERNALAAHTVAATGEPG